MSQITELAAKLFNPKQEFRPRTLPVQKRLRGMLNGKTIFDTTSAVLVWEDMKYPHYWVLKSSFTSSASLTADKPVSGINSSTSTLSTNDNSKSISILEVPESFNTPLAGLVKIPFASLDAWFEEQSQIYIHPRDPFHRVDVLPTGRHIRVEVDGVVLADSGKEGGVMSLWETNFPPRWYVPRTSVNWELLKESSTSTGCPYKGVAEYYDAVLGEGKVVKDVAWWYRNPLPECGLITGLLCFYPDRVDILVDGKKMEKISGMPFMKGAPQTGKSMKEIVLETYLPDRDGKATNGDKHNHGYGQSCNC